MSGEARRVQQKKGKNEPKEQRKPRTHRTPANLPPEKSFQEKVPEKETVSKEPGPEFYQNLKRETDEIIKITEESNAKYSKKTIQSNWKKYEAPIETYEERDEIENMGADFEQLVNAPISSGGHFQFKHEKSWDTATESSQYDKYFNIDMAKLAISLSSIPFYERNNIDNNIFSLADITAMTLRANKFKQKYELNYTECTDDHVNPTEKLIDTVIESIVVTKLEQESPIENEEVINEGSNKGMMNLISDDNFNFAKKMVQDEVIVFTNDSVEIENSEMIMEENSTKIQETQKESSDDELDILLGIKDVAIDKNADIAVSIPSKLTTGVPVQKAQEETLNRNEVSAPESEEDLEEWLDDILSK